MTAPNQGQNGMIPMINQTLQQQGSFGSTSPVLVNQMNQINQMNQTQPYYQYPLQQQFMTQPPQLHSLQNPPQVPQLNQLNQMNHINQVINTNTTYGMNYQMGTQQNMSLCMSQTSPKNRPEQIQVQMQPPQQSIINTGAFGTLHNSCPQYDQMFFLTNTQSPTNQLDQQSSSQTDELTVMCPNCSHLFSPSELLNKIYQLTQELEDCQKRLARYEPSLQQMSTISTSSVLNQPASSFRSQSPMSSPVNHTGMSELPTDSPRSVENPLLKPAGKRTSLMSETKQHHNDQRKMSRFTLNAISERLKQLLIELFSYTFQTDQREKTKKGMEQFYFKSAMYGGQLFDLKTYCDQHNYELATYGDKRLQTQIVFLYSHLTKHGCVIEKDNGSRPGRENKVGYYSFSRIILPPNMTFESKHILTMDDIVACFKQPFSLSAPLYLSK